MNKEEYKNAVIKLHDWAFRYYQLGEPVVDDMTYDELYHRVLQYEKENPSDVSIKSPTQYIGAGDLDTGFTKAKHPFKMYSMEDVFSDNDVDEWVRKLPPKIDLVLEYKLDGVSLELIYGNGVLIKAITRGDGLIGDDVTNNAMVINGIPTSIPFMDTIVIRGEVVIHKSHLNKINKIRKERGDDEIKNTRNGAAGAIRNLDINKVKEADLHFYMWSANSSKLSNDTYYNNMVQATKLGFRRFGPSKILNTHGEIYYEYLETTKIRDSLDVSLDGLVIKVNDLSIQNKMGYTNKYPRWMIAFKFVATVHIAKLIGVKHQTGRTGIITPVALLEPLNIDGVTVSRVTLHNYTDVKNKDIRIGDYVKVIRSGDVIPKIVGVVIDKRTDECIKIIPPKNCEACGSLVSSVGNDEKCTNLSCVAVLSRTIAKVCSRGCLNITGIGIKIAEELVEKEIIKTPLELFSITENDLSKLDNFKVKRIAKVLKEIEGAKGIALDKLIASLCIPEIGSTLSPVLAERFGLDFIYATYDKLVAIDGIGEELVNNILHYIDDNKEYILKMIEILEPNVTIKKPAVSSPITGKKVLVTGKFTRTRDEMKDYLISLGAIPVSSVSKNTDLVIWGGVKSSKVIKAEELGIEIWDENNFKLNMKE